jgi:hypothetical protein
VDLTPPELASALFVAKALPEKEVPLVFGEGGPGVLQAIPRSLRVHPLC